jgi:hypothetical protein
MIRKTPLFSSIDQEKERIEKERELGEKIKRFNDIYLMLFLVVTIVIGFGSTSFAKEGLSYTIMFTLLSIGLWMFGHAYGFKSFNQDLEVQAKILAWFFASLVSSTVLLKFVVGVPTLNLDYSVVSIIVSVVLTSLSYRYLREAIPKIEKFQLFWILLQVVFGAVYVVFVLRIGL